MQWAQHVVNPFRRLALHAVYHMAVNVERDGHARMPGAHLCDLRMDAGFQAATLLQFAQFFD